MENLPNIKKIPTLSEQIASKLKSLNPESQEFQEIQDKSRALDRQKARVNTLDTQADAKAAQAQYKIMKEIEGELQTLLSGNSEDLELQKELTNEIKGQYFAHADPDQHAEMMGILDENEVASTNTDVVEDVSKTAESAPTDIAAKADSPKTIEADAPSKQSETTTNPDLVLKTIRENRGEKYVSWSDEELVKAYNDHKKKLEVMGDNAAQSHIDSEHEMAMTLRKRGLWEGPLDQSKPEDKIIPGKEDEDKAKKIAEALALAKKLQDEKNGGSAEFISPNADIDEVDRLRKEIADMEKNGYGSPSMIAKQKRHLEHLISKRTVDSLEMELIKEDAKKGKIDKALDLYGGKVIEKFRDYKENTKVGRAFVKWTNWMNKGGKMGRFTKRVLLGAGVGAIIGVAASGGLAAAGVVGAGFTGARIIGSTLASGVASLTHKALTKKGLEQKVDGYASMYNKEIDTKLTDKLELVDKVSGQRIDARDRKYLNELREKRDNPEKSLTQKEAAALEAMERIRLEHARSYDRSKDNYRELVNRVRTKNERNNLIVSVLTGITVGVGSNIASNFYGLRGDAIEAIVNPDIQTPVSTIINEGDVITINEGDTIINQAGESLDPDSVPEDTPIETIELDEVVIESTPNIESSGPISIESGDGYTHIIKKAFEVNPELFEKFNVGENMSASESFEIAKKIGIVNPDGTSEFRLYNTNGTIEFELKEGELTLIERNASGKELGHFIENKGYFNPEGRKTEINYLKDFTVENKSSQPEAILKPVEAPLEVHQPEIVLTPTDNPITIETETPTTVLDPVLETQDTPLDPSDGVYIEDDPTPIEEEKKLTAKEQRQERRRLKLERKHAERMAEIRNGVSRRTGVLEKIGLFLGGAGIGYGIHDIIEDGRSTGTPPVTTSGGGSTWGGNSSGSNTSN